MSVYWLSVYRHYHQFQLGLDGSAHCVTRFHKKPGQVRCQNKVKTKLIDKSIHPEYRKLRVLAKNRDEKKGVGLADLALLSTEEGLSSGGLDLTSKTPAQVIELIRSKKCYIYGTAEGRFRGVHISSKFQSQFSYNQNLILLKNEEKHGLRTGDSGGPLICFDESNKAEVVGLASFKDTKDKLFGFTYVGEENKEWALKMTLFAP